MAKKPPADIRVRAATQWAKDHNYKTVHEAFEDKRFRRSFNRYIENPNFATRRGTGLRATKGDRERAELRLIRTLKMFGDTP